VNFFELEIAARARRDEAHAIAERERLLRPLRRGRPRMRHRLAHVLIALALWIDDAPRREPRFAPT
jgi:hypothetical protein